MLLHRENKAQVKPVLLGCKKICSVCVNLLLPAVIEAISNPFDVMQGNSFGGHVPACKCHKLSNAITSQYRNSEYGKFKITHLKKMYLLVCLFV